MEKIKLSAVRCALISEIDKGGLKMLDIESMVSARRVICLKKFLEDYPSTWKSILNSCILPVGGSATLTERISVQNS